MLISLKERETQVNFDEVNKMINRSDYMKQTFYIQKCTQN